MDDGVRAAFNDVYDFLAVTDSLESADAIFCFGSPDLDVPRRAADLYHAGVAPRVVVTGGVSHGDGVIEADAFAGLLEDAGVPSTRIVHERRSTHTGENVVLGMEALIAAVGSVSSIVAVPWPFASRRCQATFARHHPRLTVLMHPAAHVVGHRRPFTRRTIRAAIAQHDRLVDYVGLGFIAPVVIPPPIGAAVHYLREALDRMSVGAD